ncbi:thiamine phosphate synthase [Salipiger marinus]|jgi:thiamine-phosphate pyrophosphorylase|uniref:Thiamine-phosphate pyrophosphorylase n=1 Tax=Salipiger marinus TaxID=555512 RepID=A0A1G8TAH2_9RHOB|nr:MULTISPECIES: thiamine phosphate synthase [Salipiger]MCD1616877.1 thiamine phosphate synthase [Salipiger manganoxidans]MEB3420016.1 thiamine phosphate synthase [Salipiger manganoxidans]SDJ38347.1 thiamine-phosphate pyrophosphorylase [Salipiger marinus]HBM60246.1 thiamine phosphate synthase [Citreicella sp.]
MADTDQPQLYLITPPDFDLGSYPEQLARVLDSTDFACLRLSLATRDEDRLLRAADAVREVAHRFDVALVIDTHVVLAQRLGLDGVHLTDGSRSVRVARKELGPDAIVGAFCGTSRHDGMVAGEAGADYVALGPVGSVALGDGSKVEFDVFEWWSQVIELPVVAEGGLTPELVTQLAPVTDFFGIGEEIWSAEDPVAALALLTAPLR